MVTREDIRESLDDVHNLRTFPKKKPKKRYSL